MSEADRMIRNSQIGPAIPTGPVTSLYFGGGTPSLLDTNALRSIVDGLRQRFHFDDAIEITLEVNPEGISPSQVQAWRDTGFTRISLGMQSLRRNVLQLLDRKHNPEDALQVARWAQDVGIEHVSIDLIYGTPGERDDDVIASLDSVIQTGVDHVSAYALTIEPGTRLHHRVHSGEFEQPVSDTAADRYELIDDYLSTLGFEWYEISNWARDLSAQSVHNLNYWQTGDWIGFGPSAHSRLGSLRFSTEPNSAAWLSLITAGDSTVVDSEVLTPTENYHEQLITRVRLAAGFALTGPESSELLDALISSGHVESCSTDRTSRDVSVVRLTRDGRLRADQVVNMLWDQNVRIRCASDHSTVVIPVV